MTLLWYDNAHEQTRGHERHTQADDETIRFLGMPTLYDRFKRDVEELTCVSCDWPESDASERDTPRPRSRSPSADANASTSLRVAVSIPPKSARTSTTLCRYSTSARTPNSTASSVRRTWSYWGRSSNTSPKASVKLRDWWIETTSTYIAISPNSEISTSSSSKVAGLDKRRSRFWPTALPREASPSGTRTGTSTQRHPERGTFVALSGYPFPIC